MKGSEKVRGTVDSARPFVERVAHDDELHKHVKSAYDSARNIYGELFGDRGMQGVAMRVARDKSIQDEMKKTIQELRLAGQRARGRRPRTKRNATLLLAGITIGLLFNPATGPQTRRWIKERIFGPEESFEYESDS